MSEAPDSRRRFPLLDPLRALAAISILVVHTALFTGAFAEPGYGRLLAHLDIGVPFFFLLSAFLLYRPFVAARVNGTRRTGFGEYARRRFVRIAPAYWAALTVAALVPGFAGTLSGNWWAYYGLLQNYPVYTPTAPCIEDPYRCGMPVAWSLTVEVVFYLMLPLLVVAMAWLGRRWKGHWLALEAAVFAALTAVSVWIQSSVPISDLHTFAFFSPLGRGWWFGLGLMLAAVSVHVAGLGREPGFVGVVRRRPGLFVASGAGLYVLAAYTFLAGSPTLAFPVVALGEYVAQYLLFGLIAALVMLPAVFGDDGGGLTRRFVGHRTLVWLGLVSYGIFLWQFPVLIFLLDAGVGGFVPLTVLTFALTVVCAAASFYLLERPLMRRVRKRKPLLAPELA